jgi:ribosomal protein S12 methylthiotransferase accessory factor
LESAGGGAGFTIEEAGAAALAEALERYAAATAGLTLLEPEQVPAGHDVLGFDQLTLHSPQQRRHRGVPWAAADHRREVTPMQPLDGGETRWVPAALVGLRGELGGLATSSGLAADFSLRAATLRAAQELVERDALMATWLHEVPGREVEVVVPDRLALPPGAELRSFDLTPAYSPHPVCLAAASIPLLGRPRIGVGVACRSTWDAATTKATLEALQSVVFAGEHLARHPELWGLEPDGCRTFEHHAVYYTANPDRWESLPLLADTGTGADPPAGESTRPGEELADLVSTLAGRGIDLLHRELSTVDLRQIGLRVVRVISPQLIPGHRASGADEVAQHSRGEDRRANRIRAGG